MRPHNAQGIAYSNVVCDPCTYLNQEKGRFDLPKLSDLGTEQQLANPNHHPVEGGDRVTRSDANCFIENLPQLLVALAKVQGGDIIYVHDNAHIDLTGHTAIVPAGVTVASGRGLNDSPGARLYTGDNEKAPMIEIVGPNVRITGLRIEGPSTEKATPNAIGIKSDENHDCLNSTSPCLEIDHSELYGWPKAAIEIRGYYPSLKELGSTAARISVADKIHIHDNYIHHNQSKLKDGSGHFGYGVVIHDAYALIEKNVFDYNRHAIAGGGDSKSGYRACDNLVLEGQSKFKNRSWQPAIHTHAFDMHAAGPEDRGGPAGEFIHIHDNSFQFKGKYMDDTLFKVLRLNTDTLNVLTLGSAAGYSNSYVPNIKIRECPEARSPRSRVERNSFIYNDINDAVQQRKKRAHLPAYQKIECRLMIFNNVTGYDSRGKYGVGDFNGDGKADLFQAAGRGFYYTSGGSFVWRHMHNSSERLSEIGFGDFDGDGRTDLLRALNGRWEVFWSGTSEWTHLNSSSIAIERLRLGDFDGNGRTDIFRAGGGKWYVSWDGASRWEQINTFDYGVNKLAFGDFNGDGRTDVFRTSSGKWYASWGGTSKWEHINNSSYGVDELRFGDFNGDGRTDVFRSEDSKWYYSSGGTGKWIRLHGATWSLSEVIIADFTGDGKDDIARYKSRRLYISSGGGEKPYILNADFLL